MNSPVLYALRIVACLVICTFFSTFSAIAEEGQLRLPGLEMPSEGSSPGYVFSLQYLQSQTSDGGVTATQSSQEPSPFLRDLRRFEIISFGTLPFSLFFASLGYDLGRYVYFAILTGPGSQQTRENQPLLFGERSFSNEERTGVLLGAVGLSLILAGIDLIIENRNRSSADPMDRVE